MMKVENCRGFEYGRDSFLMLSENDCDTREEQNGSCA